jgi:hypothetical protein
MTDELLEELESQLLRVPVNDDDEVDRGVNTASCDCESHNGEPIREGETAVVMFLRGDDGYWVAKKTFCNICEIANAYNSIGSYSGLALIEGTLAPYSFADSDDEDFVLQDGFVWDLDGDGDR